MRTGRIRLGAVGAVTVIAALLFGAGAAQAAVAPASGPVAGGTSVTVDVPQNRFRQLASGVSHTLGLTADGTVWAWGANADGELGDDTTIDSSVPVRVQLPAGVVVTEVAGDAYSSFAVTDTGALYAWGRNNVGELGDGSTIGRLTPVLVPMPGGAAVTSVYGGYDQLSIYAVDDTVFATTSTGALYGWGANRGKFGNGTTAQSSAPVLLPLPGGAAAIDVATGFFAAYVFASDGLVYSAGANTVNGVLGRAGTATVWTPVSMINVPTGVTFTAVSAGRYEGHALGSDGVVYGWGLNTAGQLGNGTTGSFSAVPVPASMPAGVTATQLASFLATPYLLANDGSVYAWGDNTSGQLGGGTTGGSAAVPTAVPLGLPAGVSVARLTANGGGVLALLSNGTVLGWGRNFAGELDDGTTAVRPSPVAALSPVIVTALTFDGIPGTALADATLMASAVTPAHAAGPVDVVIQTQTRTDTPGPSYTEAGGFTYLATAPLVAPTITSGAPPAGQVGTPYSHTVTASGTGPIAFSLAGTLPPGLTFDPAAGTISGLPTEAGDFVFTITATSAAGSDPAAYTVTIDPAVVAVTSTTSGPSSIRGDTDLAYTGLGGGAGFAVLGALLLAVGATVGIARAILRRRRAA